MLCLGYHIALPVHYCRPLPISGGSGRPGIFENMGIAAWCLLEGYASFDHCVHVFTTYAAVVKKSMKFGAECLVLGGLVRR